MPVSYDPWIVVLSLVVASVASYVALSLGERVTETRGRSQILWLLGGAAVMGTGIWSMHFTGMLAYRLPVAIDYDLSMVVVSWVAAVSASAIALAAVSRAFMSRGDWMLGGVLMAVGIVAMHYTGMAAMRLQAVARWNVAIVAASVLIAVCASLAAMRFAYALRGAGRRRTAVRRLGAALVMGVAIAGMHYCGMAAATYVAMPMAISPDGLVSARALGGGAVAAVTLMLMLLTLGVAYADRRFAKSDRELAQAQGRFEAVMASAPIVLFALDLDGTIAMAAGRELGRIAPEGDALAGSRFDERFERLPSWRDQARRALGGEEFATVENVDGSTIEMRWTPERTAEGSLAGTIAVGTDITERRRAEEALRHQAFHDELTRLPNRAAFNLRLPIAIERARESGERVGLALLDLNRFKTVNDTLGHASGDRLLAIVAKRLAGVVRSDGFVARLGGDEFAIVTAGDGASALEAVAQRVIEAFAAPCSIDGVALEIGAAIGLAYYPDHAIDAMTLLRHADIAMYVSKSNGTPWATYDLSQNLRANEQLLLESGLRRAIEAGELRLHFQPTIDVRSGRIEKVEALVRWQHPTLGLLPPDRFIPIVEKSGLILRLTRWVLAEALRTLDAWRRHDLDLAVAINLSARSVGDPALPGMVAELIDASQTAPGRVTLEITETALMADATATRRVLAELSELGVELSIDDFGTGYSSLAYLAELPVDELKIDKRFIISMHHERKDAEIARWITGLGHVLGLRVVAEGVETASAFAAIGDIGCDVAQGYFLSRPMPAGDLERWLASSNAVAGLPLARATRAVAVGSV